MPLERQLLGEVLLAEHEASTVVLMPGDGSVDPTVLEAEEVASLIACAGREGGGGFCEHIFLMLIMSCPLFQTASIRHSSAAVGQSASLSVYAYSP